ncbi:hypothetical protein NL676_038466 [Syzygium grande]|nr:hypothetical protein NL676_038466 [Syzygium grande]
MFEFVSAEKQASEGGTSICCALPAKPADSSGKIGAARALGADVRDRETYFEENASPCIDLGGLLASSELVWIENQGDMKLIRM